MESSGATVRRELEEELGVDASSLQIDFLFSYFSEAIFNETYIDRQFNDIYMTRADLDVASLKFDHSEVSEVKFVKFEEFNEMVLSSTLAYVPTYVNEWRDVAYFVRGLRV